MLVGSFSFAMTIAVMSSVIANQDILYMEFRQKMEELSEYMNHRGMPEKLQQKLVNHFDYLFMVQYGKLEIQILDQLPQSLRSEVMKLNTPLLESHPFILGSTDPFVLEEFSKILVPRTYSPNEQVVSRKTPISCIYFIRVGKVDVLSPTDDKSTITSLLEGDHFGTYEFFFQKPSSYAHNTATFTEMLLVRRVDFEAMMSDPRFDKEARMVDFTVMLISEQLTDSGASSLSKTGSKFTMCIAENKELGGDDYEAGVDVKFKLAPEEFMQGLEKWSDQQLILEASGMSNLTRSPDGTPPVLMETLRHRSNRRSGGSFRGSRSPSPTFGLSPMGSRRVLLSRGSSASSVVSEEEPKLAGTKHRGIVLCFLEYRKNGIDLLQKVGSGEERKTREEISDDASRAPSPLRLTSLVANTDVMEHLLLCSSQVKQLKKNMGKKKKFQDMMNEEDEEVLGAAGKGVILANSTFRKLWDVLCFTGTLWYSIAVPLRLYLVTWETSTPFSDDLGFAIYVDWIYDFFFAVNIVLNIRYFATTEINEKGKVTNIVDRDAIWEEYALSGRMLIDLLIALPYDFFGFGFGSWNAFRIPKLLAAFRFPYLVTRLKGHLEGQNIFVSLDSILAINLTIATIVFTHWTSCLWGMLRENTGQPEGKFVASVYWSLTTMTTVGFGDITPTTVEGRWYTIGVIILGSCFCAGVIANITAMAHKIVISEDNAQHVTTCIEKYMLEKDMPWELRERCLRYFQMLGNLLNEDKALAQLVPPAFLSTVAQHNYGDIVSRSSVFKRVSSCTGLMQSIASMLVEQVVVQGDWVIKDNPSNEQWYYVRQGVVHIKSASKQGDLLNIIKSTSSNPDAMRCFGEYTLFFPEEKHFHAYAFANCVLVSLHPANFKTLDVLYPSEFAEMSAEAMVVIDNDIRMEPLKDHLGSLRSTRRNSIMEDMRLATQKALSSVGRRKGGRLSLFRGKTVVEVRGETRSEAKRRAEKAI